MTSKGGKKRKDSYTTCPLGGVCVSCLWSPLLLFSSMFFLCGERWCTCRGWCCWHTCSPSLPCKHTHTHTLGQGRRWKAGRTRVWPAPVHNGHCTFTQTQMRVSISSTSDVATWKLFFPLCRDLKSALRQTVAHENNQRYFQRAHQTCKESALFLATDSNYLSLMNDVFVFFLWWRCQNLFSTDKTCLVRCRDVRHFCCFCRVVSSLSSVLLCWDGRSRNTEPLLQFWWSQGEHGPHTRTENWPLNHFCL